MKQLRIMFIALMLCMGVAFQADADPQLTLGSVTVPHGGTASLDLSLTGGTEPYAGVNATLQLPDNVTVSEVTTDTGFTRDYYQAGTQTAVVAYSETATFTGPESLLVTLELQVADTVPLGTYPILFNGSGLSNADGSVSVVHTTVNGELIIIPGNIRYVDAAATGANNGSSWSDAYTDLQDALAAATSGSEIWVAEGTYTPSVEYGGTGARYRAFRMKNGVGIYGGFAGNETSREQRNWRASVTILSGALDNCYHVFYHPASLGLDNTALLDGFTISGGNADGTSWPDNSGGGMLNVSSSPTLSNCTFSDNSAINGGGMANYSSSPILTNCTFYGNSASSNGGGMFNSSSSPILTNCTFYSNSASNNGGGMSNYSSSSPTLTNCILWGDSANEMYDDSSSPTVNYCDIQGGYPGTGNIDADPLFADPTIGDFHLEFGSPCIDAGDNAAPNLPATDFDGNDRIINWTVDMGVDEAAYIPIDPEEGGTVSSPDGMASIYFSPEAIPEEVFVSLVIVDETSVPPPTGGFQLLGEVYAFEAVKADGTSITEFDQMLTLTFQYDPELVALQGLIEEDLTIQYYDEFLGWQPLLPLPHFVDTVSHTVTAETDHFTVFGLFGKPIPEPTTCVLFGFGLLGLFAIVWRRDGSGGNNMKRHKP